MIRSIIETILEFRVLEYFFKNELRVPIPYLVRLVHPGGHLLRGTFTVIADFEGPPGDVAFFHRINEFAKIAMIRKRRFGAMLENICGPQIEEVVDVPTRQFSLGEEELR